MIDSIRKANKDRVSEAILIVASQLRWGSHLTIFPMDTHTGLVMLESGSMKTEDIRFRMKVTPECLKMNPEEGAYIIDELVTQVERLEDEVETYKQAYNEERRKQSKNQSQNLEG